MLPVTVVAIGPAPADIKPGSPTRGMVISTYRRTDRAVLDVFLDTDPTPLTISAEHPVWSVNRDGWMEAADHDLFDASWKNKAALASGQISNPNGPANEIGMAGYVWSPKAEVYCVRYRFYDPLLGRWLQRDPAGYVDGLNLYTYGMGNPWAYTDPYGLWTLVGEGLRRIGWKAGGNGVDDAYDLFTAKPLA